MHPDTGHRRNNFDVLRIAAALMVLFGHSYVLSGRAAQEPLASWTGVGGFGEVGVSIFFVISGFLVAASWERRPTLRAYLTARLLRIAPALAVAVALTALVLGPLVTRLPAGAYFASPETWLYPLRNVLLYPVTYALPGVFEQVPYPEVVNGSLWTLRLEFSCYLAIPLLWWAGRGDRRLAAAAAAGAGLLLVGFALAGPALPPMAEIGTRNLYLFLAGTALWAWRGAPWTRGRAAFGLALATVAIGVVAGRWGALAATLALPLALVGFALRPLPGLSSFSRWGDYSYGVYIYAFPVQQLWMQLLGPERLGVWSFTALTLLAVAPLATASWLLVEKPALDLKARVRGRSAGD